MSITKEDLAAIKAQAVRWLQAGTNRGQMEIIRKVPRLVEEVERRGELLSACVSAYEGILDRSMAPQTKHDLRHSINTLAEQVEKIRKELGE